ncbi:MAG TPA: hypothetical protein VGW35_26715 [Methylomirabilota bacterium]|nr:hypothetical protein [Methylomirabilota bacterium]
MIGPGATVDGRLARALGLGLAMLVALVSALAGAQGPAPLLVRMDERGFTPVALEVRQGDVVTFENLGREPRWPASHIHPTHQVYPEFDPRRAIAPGESWIFRFDRVGAWNFHDHLNPDLTGTIVVRERGQTPTAKGIDPIGKLRALLGRGYETILVSAGRLYYWAFPDEWGRTLAALGVRETADREEELRYWLALAGPEALMAKLLQDSRGGSIFDCHHAAHQIGRVAYGLYGARTFQRGDASCHAGYYHGAMEAFLQERGTRNLAAEIEQLCNDFGTRFGKFQCFHGVGHGVMAYEGYNLPKALEGCGHLATAYSRGACYEGAFMENFVAGQGFGALAGHRTPWLSRDPHFPCNGISQDPGLQFHCYQMQTSWMLFLYQLDFEKVARECLRARPDMIPVCFKSFGRDAAAQSRRDPAEIARLCGRVPRVREAPDAYEQCVTGAVNVVVDFWGGRLRDQASELCRRVDDAAKRTCYAVVVSRLFDVFATSAERRQVCLSFEPAYQELCQRV